MINKASVKYIQSLQHKKFRDEEGKFFAEGPKLVTELLEAGNFECVEIYCTETGAKILTGTSAARFSGGFNIIRNFEMEKITALSSASNILGVFRKKEVNIQPGPGQKLSLVLDGIQDPGNMGTIIRIADWFGVENIFCSASTADCYNPKVVQSTMASLGRVNIIYGEIKNIFDQYPAIEKFAAVINGDDIRSFGKIKEGMIIIGNESKGISPEVLDAADKKISIQKSGAAESLNAAVATGIILHAVC